MRLPDIVGGCGQQTDNDQKYVIHKESLMGLFTWAAAPSQYIPPMGPILMISFRSIFSGTGKICGQ